MKKYPLIIALISVMAVSAGAQQTGQGSGSSLNPCESFGKKLCPAADSIKTFIQCLEEKKESLSAACRSRVDFALEVSKRFKEKRSACKADRANLCAGVAEGEGVFKCLLRNKSKCSKACQKDLSDWRRAISIAPQALKEKTKAKISAPPAKK